MKQNEYLEALKKVMDYAHGQSEKPNLSVTDIGCKVTLSDFGIEMQGRDKRKKSGVILHWRQWMNFPNDGIVTVKWDGIDKPDDMHVHQVKKL